jgi:hypothetical protein
VVIADRDLFYSSTTGFSTSPTKIPAMLAACEAGVDL